MKEFISFLDALYADELSHLQLERAKLVELRQAQMGPGQEHGAAIAALDAVIAAKKATKESLPK